MLEQQEIKRWERLTDAMLKHAASDDPEAFAQVLEVLDRAYDRLPDVVDQLRRDRFPGGHRRVRGYTWAQIGAALGVTRGSAQQRFRLRNAG